MLEKNLVPKLRKSGVPPLLLCFHDVDGDKFTCGKWVNINIFGWCLYVLHYSVSFENVRINTEINELSEYIVKN